MVAKFSPLLVLIVPPHSPPPPVDTTTVGEARIGEVGKGGIVGVGCGISVGASVGGTGVSVGIAAWVMATIVLAAATAEACTSAGSMVGTAFALHALNSSAKTATTVNIDFDLMDFILPFSFWMMNGYEVLMHYNGDFVSQFREMCLRCDALGFIIFQDCQGCDVRAGRLGCER